MLPRPPPPLVVVVAYEADDHLDAALRGLEGQFETVVVDNAGSDTAAAIAQAHNAHYLRAPTNLGFARAVNLAMSSRPADGRDVLLLNPDARLSPRDLLRLQDALHEDQRLAAVGPRLVDERGHDQVPAWPMPSPLSVWVDAVCLTRFWRGRRFVVGAVLLLGAAALADVGGLDERYFLYAEESDWQLHAQRRGWRVAVVEDVVSTHAGAASSHDAVRRNDLFYRSAALFGRKWYGPVGWQVMRLGSMAAAARRSLVGPPEARSSNRRVLRFYLGRSPAATVPGPR